jgi:hypothetical protein
VRDPVTAMGGNLAVSHSVWIVGDIRTSGSIAAGENIRGWYERFTTQQNASRKY